MLALALRRGGRLATLDECIPVLTDPRSPERSAIEVIAPSKDGS